MWFIFAFSLQCQRRSVISFGFNSFSLHDNLNIWAKEAVLHLQAVNKVEPEVQEEEEEVIEDESGESESDGSESGDVSFFGLVKLCVTLYNPSN